MHDAVLGTAPVDLWTNDSPLFHSTVGTSARRSSSIPRVLQFVQSCRSPTTTAVGSGVQHTAPPSLAPFA
eukprot:4634690-Amphidinium_carterae.1